MGVCDYVFAVFEDFFSDVACVEIISRIVELEDPKEYEAVRDLATRLNEIRMLVLREFWLNPSGDGAFLWNLYHFMNQDNILTKVGNSSRFRVQVLV